MEEKARSIEQMIAEPTFSGSHFDPSVVKAFEAVFSTLDDMPLIPGSLLSN